MISITNSAALARALDSPIDPALKRLLMLRRDQLLIDTDYDLADLAHLICVEPADTIAEIEAVVGWPFMSSPAFEWVMDHDGILEAPVILNDSGYGIVLMVPQVPGVDPALLSLLRDQLDAPPA